MPQETITMQVEPGDDRWHPHRRYPLHQRSLFSPAPSPQRRLSLAERPLREWPIQERPIERLTAHGPMALADSELLAVVLHHSTSGSKPVALAPQLISTCGDWHGL